MPAIPEHQSVDSAGTPAAAPSQAGGSAPGPSFGDMPVETAAHTTPPVPTGDDGSDRLSIRTSPVIDLTERNPPLPVDAPKEANDGDRRA